MSKKPVALIIMDGFGHNPSDYGNAIHAAKKPNLDKFMQGPNTLIGASGLDVGLPDGQMGNSEVGHTNIGAGRIVYQMLVKITKDIEDGKFFENPAISAAIDACKEKGTALHLMGLLSPGGVHSHISHLYGLLEMAKRKGLSQVYVHAFLVLIFQQEHKHKIAVAECKGQEGAAFAFHSFHAVHFHNIYIWMIFHIILEIFVVMTLTIRTIFCTGLCRFLAFLITYRTP